MKSILSLLILSIAFSCTPIEEKAAEVTETITEAVTELENPFIHHVYFYLNNPDSAEDRAELVEGLNKLAKVETIQKHYIGFPAATDREVIVKDYSISWMCLFKNMEEEEMYQVDPIHLKFVEDYSHLWSTVKIYDSVQ
ncbi:Dabb family protein [Arcticibacterium luteifluviistationis]|uniref:Stress protein n=1 Tax=Arcticibacterium luteifluviistationis TaxID=1784714 RepID=A0A2Z4GI29_9BACT|nr:Dabb family protein [Arcticibacterium luteifluviistationis]AWW00971.1 stress protein [Arcticibacterium luteifluviistationis]